MKTYAEELRLLSQFRKFFLFHIINVTLITPFPSIYLEVGLMIGNYTL